MGLSIIGKQDDDTPEETQSDVVDNKISRIGKTLSGNENTPAISSFSYSIIEDRSYSVHTNDEEVQKSASNCFCNCRWLKNLCNEIRAIQFDKRGDYFLNQCIFTQAFSEYKQALEIRKSINPHSLSTSKSHQRIAKYYEASIEYGDALSHYIRAAEILEKLKLEKFQLGEIYFHISMIYLKMNDKENALVKLLASLKLLRLYGKNSLIYAHACYHYGNIAKHIDENSRTDLFNQSFDLYKKHKYTGENFDKVKIYLEKNEIAKEIMIKMIENTAFLNREE